MKPILPVGIIKFVVFLTLIFVLSILNPISAVGFNFIKNPQPVFSGSPNYWDSVHVQDPMIIKENNLYKMWYTGNGYILSENIGFAYSINGLDNWSRLDYPNIRIGSIDNLELYISNPFILSTTLNNYQIWYDSENKGTYKYTTRYATSSDGLTWIKYGDSVLTGTTNSWDSGGTLRGKSVVYRDGMYHMWYAGQDAANLWHSWRIGYATSPDGIHWTKQNNGQPVVSKTTSWEFDNVSYPYVFLKDGVYHMFYGTGAEDSADTILYAYSKDGIFWVKPAELNPVLLHGSYAWESQNVNSPFVLVDNGKLRMWYSAYTPNVWRIGYAETEANLLPTPSLDQIPTVTPLLTPTSTSTPTPTNTPTPTPSPTPTPTPIPEKIVIIPGMGGSWNTEALLSCTLTDTNPDSWKITPYFGTAVYEPLYNSIKNTEHNPVYYPYDWRKNVFDNNENISVFLKEIAPGSQKVYLVGHSLGGLVGKSYLQSVSPEDNKLKKLLMVASPHEGALGAYPAWSAGEIWSDDLLIRIAMTTIIESCGHLHGKTNRDMVRQLIPSFGNLLPVFPYLINSKTGIYITPLDAKNTWTNEPISDNYLGTTLGTISGYGSNTSTSYTVKEASMGDLKFPNWIDGKPIQTEVSTLGDDTVLTQSEILSGVPDISLQKDHAGLINSPEGIQAIVNFLDPTAITPITTTSTMDAKSALMIIAYPSSLWITDPSWGIRKDLQSMVGFINPKNGSYHLLIVPTSETTRLIVAQFLPNNKSFWKEYTLTGKLPKIHTVNFNQENPQEDILD